MNRLLLLLAACVVTPAAADDWPQWMGPQRDNIWRETGLLEKFPESGPTVVWRMKIAGGYSGPAVAGGRVVITDYVTKQNVKVDNFRRKEFSGIERVLCLDEKTGKVVWKHEYPVKYTISYPAGPRCTPVIHNGKVYTLGAEGHLFCFNLAKGEIVWSKDFKKDYKTKTALWGYASHPLIDGNKLLCVVGGKGSHVVAFDKNTGKEIWKSVTSAQQGYAPPTIFKIAGVRQLILLRPDAVTSVNPENGKQYWSVPYKASSGSIIMSPVVWKKYLFVGGFNQQTMMIELDTTKPAAKILWQNKKNHGISPVNVQPFVEDGVIYGFDQSGRLHGVEIPSGKRLWGTSQPVGTRPVGSGTAFIVKQGKRFWMFTEKGQLVIARLSKTGFEEIDRATVIEPSNVAFGRDVVWSMPAFANRKIFVRNDKEIVCVDLSKK